MNISEDHNAWNEIFVLSLTYIKIILAISDRPERSWNTSGNEFDGNGWKQYFWKSYCNQLKLLFKIQTIFHSD